MFYALAVCYLGEPIYLKNNCKQFFFYFLSLFTVISYLYAESKAFGLCNLAIKMEDYKCGLICESNLQYQGQIPPKAFHL